MKSFHSNHHCSCDKYEADSKLLGNRSNFSHNAEPHIRPVEELKKFRKSRLVVELLWHAISRIFSLRATLEYVIMKFGIESLAVFKAAFYALAEVSPVPNATT